MAEGASASGFDSIEIDGWVEVLTDKPYVEMMEEAGFSEVWQEDVTDEYERVLTGWLSGWDKRRADMLRVLGQETFESRFRKRSQDLEGIRMGILSRHLLFGRA